MNYKNKFIISFLLLTVGCFGFACKTQTATNNSNSAVSVPGSAAQSPTEAYKMLFAAVKAKDAEKIKSLMTKNTLGLAQFNAERQKIPLEKSVENGLVATTIADAITEIRDERVKGVNGAIEVFNQKDNRWEDLPFMLEDGGWKLAVGDLFQGKYESPGKSKGDIEREASNTGMPMPTNGMSAFPKMSANSNSTMMPANSSGNKSANPPSTDRLDKKDKSVEVPKEGTPK